MKRTFPFGINVILVCLIFGYSTNFVFAQDTQCDIREFRTCLQNTVDTALSALSQNVAGICGDSSINITAGRECVTSFVSRCSSTFGTEKSTLIGQYVQTLEDVFTTLCDQDFQFSQPEICRLDTAVSCLGDFTDVLAAGSITTVCRQLDVTLACVQPSLETCTDRPRYFIARVLNDLQLTYDTVCYESGCNLDIAKECVQDANEIYDYPITIVSQSSLVCSKLKASLACAYNHTFTCVPGTIPPGIEANYVQMSQFATVYCGLQSDNFMLRAIPEDLKSTVVLASLSINRWSSIESVCLVYNETLLKAANEGRILTQYTRDLLTWQNAMKLNLDKYGDVCFQQQMMDCDWVDRLANEQPVCDVDAAARCFDLYLLSKLVVETKVQRATWDTVCVAMVNMAACSQFYTGACSFNEDLSQVNMVASEVERLVGYECAQLGVPTERPESCDEDVNVCDVQGAIKNCGNRGNNQDICSNKDEIVKCLQEHTSICNSVQASPAQFYMEWLLNSCELNATVIGDDTLKGVALCNMQFGYSVYNGITTASDFGPVICNALTSYGSCLSQQTTPALASYYINQYSEYLIQTQFIACNTSTSLRELPPSQEDEACPASDEFGRISLAIQMSGAFPLMSILEQDQFCSMIAAAENPSLSTCSETRQAVITEGRDYLNVLYRTYCSVSRSDLEKQCDAQTLQMCFENFGGFTYFSTQYSDICSQLEETYSCIYKHAKGCDALTATIIQEVDIMHSLLGNVTCPPMSWCSEINNSSEAWMTQICSPSNTECDLLNWSNCLVENGYSFDFNLGICDNQLETIVCIESRLSGCDPVQYSVAKTEVLRQMTPEQSFFCPILPQQDPVIVEPIHESIIACYMGIYTVFQTGDTSKNGICGVLSSFEQCLGRLDQGSIPSVWQGVISKSRLMWGKEIYLHCQVSAGNEEFIVHPDFEVNDFFGDICNEGQGKLCLYYMLELVVSYQPFVPLDVRFTVFCQSLKSYKDCVGDNVRGCLLSQENLLPKAEWVMEASDNIGTCSASWTEPRLCDPDRAVQCLSELGQFVARIDGTREELKIMACSNLQPTTLCVNKYTSGCDYEVRDEIEKTFHEIFTVAREICTAPPVSSDNNCINTGEIITCDVEEALMCLIPVQAALLHTEANLQGACGLVPAMKTCIHRHTTGCDAHAMAGFDRRLQILSRRMNDQCPYIYCDQCKARQCLENLHIVLQYDDVNLCLAVTDAKQCISNYAGYCDSMVQEALLQEMSLLVGEEGQICEISVDSCLQSFFNSAFQIVNYNPQFTYMNQNMSSVQTDAVFTQLCQEATAAYFCVEYHLTAATGTNMTSMGMRNVTAEETPRWALLNTTLHRIGDVVGNVCKGPRLECYSCVNATSNEECNMMETQSCPLDKQMCGTMLLDNTISKGCVAPPTCQTGCMGGVCTFCCEGDMCNQPWNTVIQEPATCQPESALWCGFQLLYSLVQNDTINCRVLHEAASCMSENTRSCISHESGALGVYAQHLMSSDVMTTCLDGNAACSCGQCSSLILLSVITSPYQDVDAFCSTIWKMYNQTVQELDLNTCSIMALQSTAYNLEMASRLAYGICDVNRGGNNCSYGNTSHGNGASFMAMDGCNTCTCMDGQIGCTLVYCPPPANGSCLYEHQIYEDGASFTASDGCNTCTCFNGNLGCTEMYCEPTDGQCDLFEIYTCMSDADIFNKVSSLSTHVAPELCSSAAHMLQCLEPKLQACSPEVLYVIQAAIMENLNAVQMYCDVYDIITNYANWGATGNQTDPEKPDPEKPHVECSVEKGLQCFELEELDDRCAYFQSVIDCVYTNTVACLSVDALPVTYQLQSILHSHSGACELDIPSKPTDPLSPIAHCTMEFATSLNEDLYGSYLPYHVLDTTCGHLEEYGECLYSAQLPPLGQFYVWKIESSLSTLVNMCEENQQHPTNPCASVSCLRPDCDNPYTPDGQCCPVCPESSLRCHNCSMTTDMEACDNMEPETCQPNQVCGTIMEVEPNSGVTMVRKGCADIAWCQTWMGCDQRTMTCISCCYGDLCNMAAPTEQTTSRPEITGRPPGSCNLESISNYMVMQILKLMNHGTMPLRERQYACTNVTSDLEEMVSDLDPKCSDEVMEHVSTATEWLNHWTRSICRDFEAETKCLAAVQCMEDFGNFPDRNTTCKTLGDIQTCLKSHFKYCGDADKASINQTSELLGAMEHLVCVPNKLADRPVPECVNVTEEYRMNKAGMCNVTKVEECVMSLQKAAYNPFVTGEQFCRLAKSGMKCVQENTYNCSEMVTQNLAPVLEGVVNHVSGQCPETWCPAYSHCKLETAKKCLNDLEEKIMESMSEEEFDRSVCMEFSRTHDCIINSTYECYSADIEMVIFNFTQIALHVAPMCLYHPPNVTECGLTFLQTIDNLVQFDDIFVLNLANTHSNHLTMVKVMEAMEYFLNDMFPEFGQNDDSKNRNGSTGMSSNPYIRKRRSDHEVENSIFGMPEVEDEFWSDNKTRNSTDLPNNGTRSPTDVDRTGDFSALAESRELNRPEYLGLNIPYSSNVNTGTELNEILKELEMDIKDLAMLIDGSVLMEYNKYKSNLCHLAQQSFECLEHGTRQVFFTGNQEYIVNVSLTLLAQIAMEECHGMRMCHSCNGLDSNAECNRQAPVNCPPLHMCQTWSVEGNITKGCVSALTCEEECRHSDKPCYCCHGDKCNKRQEPKTGECDKQTAVRCTQDLLRSSLYGEMGKRSSAMIDAASCMIASTEGCHGDTYYQFYQKGEIIMNLLSAAQCASNYGDVFCGSTDAVTLAAIVSNPLKTPGSMDITCSLFEKTLYSFYLKEQQGHKCDNMEEVLHGFLSIYAEIKPYCGEAMVTEFCGLLSDPLKGNETSIVDRITDRVMDRMKNRLNGQNSLLGERSPLRNLLNTMIENHDSRTGSDVIRTGSDVIEKFCLNFEDQSEGVCDISTAIVSCYSSVLYLENPVCDESNPNYPVLLQCVQDLTSGCVDAQLTPILLMHTIVCGQPLGVEQNLSTSGVLECLQVTGDIAGILSLDDDVFGGICPHLQELERCLDSADISAVDKMLMHPMFLVLDQFKEDVCNLVVDKFEYLVSCPDNTGTSCNGSVCATSTCPAYPGATCVEDSCSECRPKFFFRGIEVTDNCTDTYENCSVDYISKEVMINLALVAGLESLDWNEQAFLCVLSDALDFLKDSANECPEVYAAPLRTLLDWFQRKVDARCHVNTLSYACLSPTCDPGRSLEVINGVGVYLTTANMEDHVFCQKIANTLSAVECSLRDCVNETQTEIVDALDYVRSNVRDRCPGLTSLLYCETGLPFSSIGVESNETTGRPTDLPTRSTTASPSGSTGTSTGPTNRPTGPTNRPTGRPTGQPGRARRHAGTDHNSDGRDDMEYKDGENMEHSDNDEHSCPVPACSYDDAEGCIKKCGSAQETTNCVMTATQGCNPVAKYAIYSILKFSLGLQEVPRECWVNVSLEVEESYASGVLQCIHNLTEKMESVLYGDSTDAVSSCDVFIPLLDCMEREMNLPGVPTVLRMNLIDLIGLARPPLTLICSQIGDEKRSLAQVSDETEECQVETAARCLNYFSVNMILNPALPQGWKQWTCQNLDSAQECVYESVKGCTKERRETAMSLHNSLQLMGVLTGSCTPQPFTCEPAETFQCVTELAAVVSSHGVTTHQGNVCRAIELAETCIRQTTSYCEYATMKMIQKTLEPIRCQAYSICPMAANKPKMPETESERTCIPLDYERDDKHAVCQPGEALQCLYRFYKSVDELQDQSNDALCSLYGKALSCYSDNLKGCSGDEFSVLLVFRIFKSWNSDASRLCTNRGELFCDLEKEMPDCALGGVDACFDTLEEVLENGRTEETCFALTETERCVESKLSSCPFLVKMYGKASLFQRSKELQDSQLYEPLNCDGIHQCVYSYTALMQEILLAGQNDANYLINGDLCQSTAFREDIYPCSARGQDLLCIYSDLEEYPSDVAMVINMTVNHFDEVFSNVCGALLGWQLSSVTDSVSECYLSGLQNYFPLLLSFVNMERESNISSFTSYEFCSSFAEWEASFELYQTLEGCVSSNMTIDFNEWFLSEMHQLEVTYCTRPCNTTNADLCLASLEEAITTNTSEEVCDLYNSVKTCLQDAISSCAASISDQYFSEAETMFVNAGLKCYTLPSIEITLPTSLSIESPVFEVMEGSDALQFSIAVTSSIRDGCFSDNCQIEFYVEIEGVPSISCSSTTPITQFLSNTCALYFTDDSLGQQQTLTFELRIDHRIQDPYNATFNFVARLWDDNTPVKTEVVRNATVMVKEMQTGGSCGIVSDPMVTTFDGLAYYNFRQGELLLYQHDTMPEKVHIALQRCTLLSYIPCPCAVMVVSGDDTFIVDVCRRFGETFHPIDFRVYQNEDLTPYTRVHVSSTRQSYQFVLPSGSIVYVQLDNNMLDVIVKPSSLAWDHTSGLCGTYNGVADDDLTLPNGDVLDPTTERAWSGLPVPIDFSSAWTPTASIFFGAPANESLVYMENSRCECTSRPCIETNIVETCDLVSAEDITNDLTPYLQPVTVTRRRKRQTQDTPDFQELTTDLTGFENFTWPTPKGNTLESASQHCNDAMANSVSWEVCKNVVDVNATLQVCLANILLFDSTDSTASVIENMVTQCQLAVVTNPSILVNLNTTLDKLFPYTITCPDNCNNVGACVNGTCECNTGFGGEDCSLLLSTPPVGTSLSINLNSIEQGTGLKEIVSADIYVNGENFINTNNLRCHQEEVQFTSDGYELTGNRSTSNATLLTFGRVMCTVTGTLPLTGLLVSVSNDGENQSQGFLYIVHDTVCYSCNAADGQCTVQPVSCLTDDDQCFGPGVYKPDDGCYLCSPISNKWEYKISPNCPAPTTTTVSTTTPQPTTTTGPATTTTGTATTKKSSPAATTITPTVTNTQPGTTTETVTTTAPQTTATQQATSSTTLGTSGGNNGLGGNQSDDDDDDEQETMTIIIAVASGIGALLIVTVIVLAFKLRKSSQRDRHTKLKRVEESSSSGDGSELAGRQNPSYVDAENPGNMPRRDYQGRSGPFNPAGLGGESAYRQAAEGQPLDVAMFEQQGIPRPRVSSEPYADYDYAVIKRGADISRQARKGDPLYDNAERRAKADAYTDLDMKDKIAPRAGYSMEESPLRPAFQEDVFDTRL